MLDVLSRTVPFKAALDNFRRNMLLTLGGRQLPQLLIHERQRCSAALASPDSI